MQTIIIVKIVLAVALLLGGAIFMSIRMAKQSKADWQTINDLTEECGKVKTRAEIESLEHDIHAAAKQINNQYCQIQIGKMLSYLKGLYVNAK